MHKETPPSDQKPHRIFKSLRTSTRFLMGVGIGFPLIAVPSSIWFIVAQFPAPFQYMSAVVLALCTLIPVLVWAYCVISDIRSKRKQDELDRKMAETNNERNQDALARQIQNEFILRKNQQDQLHKERIAYISSLPKLPPDALKSSPDFINALSNTPSALPPKPDTAEAAEIPQAFNNTTVFPIERTVPKIEQM